jgi:hypothetical protein
MSSNVTLVGDAIENPANALTMTHAAAMFGASCRFRDTKGLASSEMFATGLPAISSDQVRTLHSHSLPVTTCLERKTCTGSTPAGILH